MGVQLKQNADGSMGLQGTDLDEGQFIASNIEYTAASVSKATKLCTRRQVVKQIIGRVTVAGSDAGAVTAQIFAAPSGTALSAGTLLHTGSFNLKGTANANQVLSIAATGVDLAAGSVIGIVFTGVLTAATGVITVSLAPA